MLIYIRYQDLYFIASCLACFTQLFQKLRLSFFFINFIIFHFLYILYLFYSHAYASCICLFHFKFKSSFLSCSLLPPYIQMPRVCLARIEICILKNKKKPFHFCFFYTKYNTFFFIFNSISVNAPLPSSSSSLTLFSFNLYFSSCFFFILLYVLCYKTTIRLCNCDLGCQISILCLSIFYSNTGFLCLVIYRRDTHVVELQIGNLTSRLEDACAPDQFDVFRTPFTTLLGRMRKHFSYSIKLLWE
jgi:hypothetical protein